MANQEPDYQKPRTIDELKAWYAAAHLPPEHVTRFFIGKNIKEPRAFGIYQEGDRFIVYKNKDDGSRAVRYHGPDEAYAVNELWQRLRAEIHNQKARNQKGISAPVPLRDRLISCSIVIITLALIAILSYPMLKAIWEAPNTGYYRYDDAWYYYDSGWYGYSDYWYPLDEPTVFADNWDDYYESSYYRSDYADYDLVDFKTTEYYELHISSDDSWSSSDSWDSGSTDWSSDW